MIGRSSNCIEADEGSNPSFTKNLKKYFSSIGKKGGSVKSAAKKKSSKENGKKGGRPKKIKI